MTMASWWTSRCFRPSSPRRRPRRDWSMCRIDRLECRALPSGNVTAVLAGSTLTFEGDIESNAVVVTQDENGDVRVTGLSGTTINGERSILFRAEDLPDGLNVVARGNAGNDSLTVRGLTLEGTLTVQGNEGHDTVRVLGADLGGLILDGGTGFNVQSVVGTTLSGTPGDLVVTGDGFNIARFLDVQVGGSATIYPGDSFNLVSVIGSNFEAGTDFSQVVHEQLAQALNSHLEVGQELLDNVQEHLSNVSPLGSDVDFDALFEQFRSGGLTAADFEFA